MNTYVITNKHFLLKKVTYMRKSLININEINFKSQFDTMQPSNMT